MNRSPTPGGMFATHFVGVRNVIAIRSPRNWQTVRSRMGGFIVPAYMNVPTKWQSVRNVLAIRSQP